MRVYSAELKAATGKELADVAQATIRVTWMAVLMARVGSIPAVDTSPLPEIRDFGKAL